MRFNKTSESNPDNEVGSRGGSGQRPTRSLRVVLVHPKGAILPPEMPVKHIKASNFLERLSLGSVEPVSLIELSAREAEMIAQFSDVLGIDFMVLTGLPNAQYDTVWNMYTATLERISLETLPAFLVGIGEIANAPAPASALSEEQTGYID
jgi:hypothetical protein